MLTYFTRILIFTLILTAPLSFTGDKCPDFKPISSVSQIQENPSTVQIVKDDECSPNPLCPAEQPSFVNNRCSSTSSYRFNPITASVSLLLRERAPPSFLS